MNRTPLYNLHLKDKAHMEDFNGWQMPIYYTGLPAGRYGIIAEHRAVRQSSGLFDLCHMARLKIEGAGARNLIQRLTTNDVSTLKPGDIQYSLICNQEAGILDDILIYNLGESYLLVVNAGNRDAILSWFEKWAGQDQLEAGKFLTGQDQLEAGKFLTGQAGVKDISPQMAMLAIQGPASQIILQRLTDIDLSLIKYYHFSEGKIKGITVLISRTGYTGEDGFELYFDSGSAETLWSELLAVGKDYGLQPIGLGARDTLRLEAALPLYGNELNAGTNPFEAGLERFVKLNKGDFIGRQALIKIKDEGIKRKLIGFEMVDRAISRAGYSILKDRKCIGRVTSGSFSPTLNKNIGLGYAETGHAYEGCEFEIEIRGKPVRAKNVKTPFYPVRKDSNGICGKEW